MATRPAPASTLHARCAPTPGRNRGPDGPPLPILTRTATESLHTMRKPRIALLATGGTIAGTAGSATDTSGYTAGQLGADALIAAARGARPLAMLRSEEEIASNDKLQEILRVENLT